VGLQTIAVLPQFDAGGAATAVIGQQGSIYQIRGTWVTYTYETIPDNTWRRADAVLTDIVGGRASFPQGRLEFAAGFQTRESWLQAPPLVGPVTLSLSTPPSPYNTPFPEGATLYVLLFLEV